MILPPTRLPKNKREMSMEIPSISRDEVVLQIINVECDVKVRAKLLLEAINTLNYWESYLDRLKVDAQK